MQKTLNIHAAFRDLLAGLDPRWTGRSPEEQSGWVDWYGRTARAISRQFARSFRDPSHDDADVLQEILLRLVRKFQSGDVPARLLTQRPWIRNLMKWKALDRVDWENAQRRSARRRASLPDDDIGIPARNSPTPDRWAEVAEAERAFGRDIPDPEEREVYRLLRTGRPHQEVARILGRKIRETKALCERLVDDLRTELNGS